MADMDPEISPAAEPDTVGSRLRAARLAAGLELSDIAERTRVPLRHLEAIERADYRALPATTYATGFSRAYARALDIDEAPLIRDLRVEMGRLPENPEYQPYEAADPARVPPRWLAWGGVVAALIVVALFGWWYSTRTALPPETLPAPAQAPQPSPVATAPGAAPPGSVAATPPLPAAGPVVLTARQPVWLRVYDAGDTRLFEKELAQGERYQVPADANRPMLLTGRPEALEVSVGGRAIPPLGDGSRTVSGVVLTAEALAARPAAAPPSPPAPSP